RDLPPPDGERLRHGDLADRLLEFYVVGSHLERAGRHHHHLGAFAAIAEDIAGTLRGRAVLRTRRVGGLALCLLLWWRGPGRVRRAGAAERAAPAGPARGPAQAAAVEGPPAAAPVRRRDATATGRSRTRRPAKTTPRAPARHWRRATRRCACG